MPRESAYDKASRYLAEARVTILEAHPHGIAARVRGEGATYTVRWFADWSCTCPNARGTCSHVAALKRITSVDLDTRTRSPRPGRNHP